MSVPYLAGLLTKPRAIHHYFLSLAYDGTAYRGWQRQPGGVITVQQTLEDTLSEVHRREVILGGCGRTDAGVHASQYYAYLRNPTPLPDNYLFVLQKRLPSDISVRAALPVPDNAQARYDATERTYDYFFHTAPDPWLDRTSSWLPLAKFQPQRLAAALPGLIGEADFRAFCKAPDRHNTTIVDLRQARLYHNAAGNRFRLRFVANRFLRGMIRLLVDNLLRVGNGTLTVEDPAARLLSQERPPRFALAPPQGLFLSGVRYPYLDNDPQLPPTAAETAWLPVTPAP